MVVPYLAGCVSRCDNELRTNSRGVISQTLRECRSAAVRMIGWVASILERERESLGVLFEFYDLILIKLVLLVVTAYDWRCASCQLPVLHPIHPKYPSLSLNLYSNPCLKHQG